MVVMMTDASKTSVFTHSFNKYLGMGFDGEPNIVSTLGELIIS